MKKTGIILPMIAAITMATTGCKNTSGLEGTASGGENVSSEAELNKAIDYNSSSLKHNIRVTDLRSTNSGNLMKAQASIVSKTRKTLTLQYKFVWLDRDGMEIDSGSKPWNPIVVHGDETKSIQSVSQNSSATQFKIKIRLQK